MSHRGTTSGGHYVAHRKFDGDVYEYNDDRMSLQREKEIENDDEVTIILLSKTTNWLQDERRISLTSLFFQTNLFQWPILLCFINA